MSSPQLSRLYPNELQSRGVTPFIVTHLRAVYTTFHYFADRTSLRPGNRPKFPPPSRLRCAITTGQTTRQALTKPDAASSWRHAAITCLLVNYSGNATDNNSDVCCSTFLFLLCFRSVCSPVYVEESQHMLLSSHGRCRIQRNVPLNFQGPIHRSSATSRTNTGWSRTYFSAIRRWWISSPYGCLICKGYSSNTFTIFFNILSKCCRIMSCNIASDVYVSVYKCKYVISFKITNLSTSANTCRTG